jgi:parvulin-like peptidyl-prolyl isomerase
MSLKQAARAVALFCAFLLLATPAIHAEVIEEVVAWVDGDIITSSELEEEEQGVMAEAYRQFAGEELDEKVEQLRRDLLLGMIDRKILLHRAQIMFDTDQMAKIFYEGFLQQQGIDDEEELARALAREGMTIDDLKKRLTEMFAPEEVMRHEVGSRVGVTDGELQTYYDEHPDQFVVKEEVTIREIVLLADSDQAKNERRAEATELRNRAAAEGADFAEIAVEVSEAGTAEAGGMLGPLHRGELSEQLEAQAFSLPVGEVSQVLEMPYGFHIIVVESRTEESLKPLEEVGDDLRRWLEDRKYFEERNEFLKKARDESEWCVKPAYADRLPAEFGDKSCRDL